MALAFQALGQHLQPLYKAAISSSFHFNPESQKHLVLQMSATLYPASLNTPVQGRKE